jgi:hypothetical protein
MRTLRVNPKQRMQGREILRADCLVSPTDDDEKDPYSQHSRHMCEDILLGTFFVKHDPHTNGFSTYLTTSIVERILRHTWNSHAV